MLENELFNGDCKPERIAKDASESNRYTFLGWLKESFFFSSVHILRGRSLSYLIFLKTDNFFFSRLELSLEGKCTKNYRIFSFVSFE